MTTINLPPLCPVCGGKTTVKEVHRASRLNKLTCFFRCVDCGTDYPQSVNEDDAPLPGPQTAVPEDGIKPRDVT